MNEKSIDILIKVGVFTVVSAITAPMLIPAEAQFVSMFTPKYACVQEAQEHVQETARSLGIDAPVNVRFNNADLLSRMHVLAYVGQTPDSNGYQVVLTPWIATPIEADHELYHIKQHGKELPKLTGTDQGDSLLLRQRGPWSFKEIYTQEWQAALYSITGIKL